MLNQIRVGLRGAKTKEKVEKVFKPFITDETEKLIQSALELNSELNKIYEQSEDTESTKRRP